MLEFMCNFGYNTFYKGRKDLSMKTLINKENVLFAQNKITKWSFMSIRNGEISENTTTKPGNDTFRDLDDNTKKIVFLEAKDAFQCFNDSDIAIFDVTNQDTLEVFNILNILDFSKSTLQLLHGLFIVNSAHDASYDFHMIKVNNGGFNYILGFFTKPVVDKPMHVRQAFLWKSNNPSEFAIYDSPEKFCYLFNIFEGFNG